MPGSTLGGTAGPQLGTTGGGQLGTVSPDWSLDGQALGNARITDEEATATISVTRKQASIETTLKATGDIRITTRTPA